MRIAVLARERMIVAHDTYKLSAMDRNAGEVRVFSEFQHQANFGNAART